MIRFVYCLKCPMEFFSDLDVRRDTVLIYDQVVIKNKFKFFLYKLHSTYKINRFVDIPFKKVWDKYFPLKKMKFDKNDKNFVIIMDSALTYYTPEYLTSLKGKCKRILLLFNPYSELKNNKPWYKVFSKCKFDMILSCFDVRDPVTIGSIHTNYVYSKQSVSNSSVKNDMLFLGLDKGRYHQLVKVFDKASEKGFRPDFRIINYKGKMRKKEFTYCGTIPYRDYLNMISHTKCIVEIVQDCQKGVTLRTFEAIVYGKHLLTNNKYVLEMPFYDPRFIHYFCDVDDIDFSFLKKENYILPDYGYSDEFSPIHLNKQIFEFFERQCPQ